MKIYTATFFDKKNHVGNVFSIANSQPNYGEYKVIEELKPEWKYVVLWNKGNGSITWEQFAEYYIAKLNSCDRMDRVISTLNELNESITLCCWEKDFNFCHRSLAALWLKDKYNFEVVIR